MSTPAAPGMNLINAFVRLKNESDREFNMHYSDRGERLIIAPGAEVVVAEEVAMYYLGHWYLDNGGRDRARLADYQRLRALYGAYEREDEWEKNRPRLVAFDASGNRIITVVEDPDGNSGPQGGMPLSGLTLEQQIATLTATVNNLLAERDQQGRQQAATQFQAPEDVPNLPPPAPGTPAPSIPLPDGTVVQTAAPPILAPTLPPPVAPDGEEPGAPPRLPVIAEPIELPDTPAADTPAGAHQDAPVPEDTPDRVKVG